MKRVRIALTFVTILGGLGSVLFFMNQDTPGETNALQAEIFAASGRATEKMQISARRMQTQRFGESDERRIVTTIDVDRVISEMDGCAAEARAIANSHGRFIRVWQYWTREREIENGLREYGKDSAAILSTYWAMPLDKMTTRDLQAMGKVGTLEILASALRYARASEAGRNEIDQQRISNIVKKGSSH
jgi:hypothetical protein